MLLWDDGGAIYTIASRHSLGKLIGDTIYWPFPAMFKNFFPFPVLSYIKFMNINICSVHVQWYSTSLRHQVILFLLCSFICQKHFLLIGSQSALLSTTSHQNKQLLLQRRPFFCYILLPWSTIGQSKSPLAAIVILDYLCQERVLNLMYKCNGLLPSYHYDHTQ